MPSDASEKNPKTNYQILEENQKAALDFAFKLNGEAKPIDTGTNPVSIALSNGEFSLAIRTLAEIKDNRLGITWHESDDLGNGTKALVYDARNVTTDRKKLEEDAYEKYGMQILNEVRASMLLIEQSGLDDNQKKITNEKLMFFAQEAIKQENLEQLNNKSKRSYNTQLLHILEESGLAYDSGLARDAKPKEMTKFLKSELNFAKQLSGLYDEHKHIITLRTVKDDANKEYVSAEADIMLNGLTEKQKEQYESIAGWEGKDIGIEWFDKMPKYKKNLLRDVAGDIATGNKVLPTQFLSETAGLRNAYKKVSAIKENKQEKGAKNYEIIVENYHSGTPASRAGVASEKERQEIVEENIKQMQSFVPEGKKINVNIFNSRSFRDTLQENDIFKQVKQATQKMGAAFSASPINNGRIFFAGRDTRVFKNNLRLIGDKLPNSLEGSGIDNIKSYLQEGMPMWQKIVEKIPFIEYKSLETKAKEELGALRLIEGDKAQLLNAIETAMETQSLLSVSKIFSLTQNVNMQVSANMDIIQTSVEKGALKTQLGEGVAKDYPINFSSCKSGKDRTHVVASKATRLATAQHCNMTLNKDNEKDNFLSQVGAGHAQKMAGIQGGTVGCDSIKTNKISFQVLKEDSIADGIINQKSSGHNNVMKLETGDKKESLIKDFEYGFSSKKTMINKEPDFIEKVKEARNLREFNKINKIPKKDSPSIIPNEVKRQSKEIVQPVKGQISVASKKGHHNNAGLPQTEKNKGQGVVQKS